MAVWQIDGVTPTNDVRSDRIAAGTVGSEHGQPAGLIGKNMTRPVKPLNRKNTYSGGGAWTISIQGAWDFLGQRVTSSTAGSQVDIRFSGTSVTLMGCTGPDGGQADIYIDGVLTSGGVNTYTYLSAAYNVAGLIASDTSLLVGDTTNFTSSGVVRIDQEDIEYSSVSGTSFDGCTRGYNGTIGSQHDSASTVRQVSSTVEFYSPYIQNRIIVWSGTNLPAGDHVLSVVVRSTKNASSSGHKVVVEGLVSGGLLAARNIHTYTDNITITGLTITSFRTDEASLLTSTGDSQIIGILGAYAIAGTGGDTLAIPLWNPLNNKISFECNVSSGSGVSIVLTCVYLGQGL